MVEQIFKYLSARVGSQWYGIEVGQVIEVLHLVAFTEIPVHQEDVLGLITVRAEVMPLIDVRRRFQQAESQLRLDTPLIAIRGSTGPMALVFDDVDRVEELNESMVTSAKGSHKLPYISGVAKLHDRLLLLLDVNQLAQYVENVPLQTTTTKKKSKRKSTETNEKH